MEKFNFEVFFSKGGLFDVRMVEKNFFSFSKFQIFFFEKWLQWDQWNVERNKVMKFELTWGIHRGVTRNCLHVWAQSAHSHVV